MKVFLKLGITGFGGPAAHIAMMRTEVVEKKKWLSESEFLDLIGATNLIPGPNSTELAIFIGYKLQKVRGLILAGLSFILPAFLIVLSLSIIYQRYGRLPEVSGVLFGMRPVIFAIVLLAIWKFSKTAIKNTETSVLLVLSFIMAYYNVHELVIIFGSGVLLALRNKKLSLSIDLFLFFLKVGGVLFGSGYVLIAYLQRGLVEDTRWLSSTQLLDAISIGQVTPGPVFTTATFIGYQIDGFLGACVSTIGIFLPSFVFVGLLGLILKHLKTSEWFRRFIDGVNAGSIGLMGFVLLEIGQKSLVSVTSLLIGGVALMLLLKFRSLNSVVLILAGALIGFFFTTNP